MIPSLATRGKLVLSAAALMVLVGAFRGAPPLVALGGTHHDSSIFLRRRRIAVG